MLIRVFLMSAHDAEQRRLRGLLDLPDVLVTGASGKASSWQQLARESVDVVVASSAVLEAPVDGSVQALRSLPDVPDVIVLAPGDDAEERASLLAAGCSAVLSPELPDAVLESTFATLVQRRREQALEGPRHLVSPQRARLDDFVSASPAMQKLIATAHRVANVDTSLLILGETGVGKERLARAIHSESPRAAESFVAINCSAIPESLLESELFGYAKGAFTGASRARRGHFELAHGGTFFLDEVGELPPATQVKLLRVLQEHVIQPLGSERAIPVDVRIIAATNRDLDEEIRTGNFRNDLYYRLGVVTLTLPPLRERRDDVSQLVTSYCEHFARYLGRAVTGVTREAMARLVAYQWPGNVRELINVMEHAVLLCDNDVLDVGDLPSVITGAASSVPVGLLDVAWPTAPGSAERGWRRQSWRSVRDRVLAQAEREYLIEILRATGGRIGAAAERAGMAERSLFEKMRRHGLAKERFRP